MPYKDWHVINTAQRIAANYIESFPHLIIFTILSGLFYTNIAVGLIWAILVGRVIYCVGYKIAPKMRGPGFLIVMLCTVTMMILSFIGVIQNITGNKK